MKIDLSPYTNKKICVAVSGGKDSMSLLHYMKAHAGEYKIEVSAINFDHRIRGEESARDSAFVADWCKKNDVPLFFYEADEPVPDENTARRWRLCQYCLVMGDGKADFVATAHHMNDNAETVLFNLARGSGLSGVIGIQDSTPLGIIHPMIGCSREEIDEYIKENDIPYVTDSTNFSDDYTRNKIRHNVIPALEEAVPGAVKAIYRFSRLAAEEDEYLFDHSKKFLKVLDVSGYLVKPCKEKVIFRRAVLVVFMLYKLKDYTAQHINRIYDLQFAETGKKFCFLGLTAIKERDGVSITRDDQLAIRLEGADFYDTLKSGKEIYGASLACVVRGDEAEKKVKELKKDFFRRDKIKTLKFDLDKIPKGAVIRYMRDGDKFRKFGGGTKSLGDFFTDRKISVVARRRVPLVCIENEVLIVGGVEISDDIKITEDTKTVGAFICLDKSENKEKKKS